MYTVYEDKRRRADTTVVTIPNGDCFIFDGLLCMIIDAYEHVPDGDEYIYGVVLSNPAGGREYVGDVIKLHNSAMVEAVNVRGDFVILP